MGLLAGAITHGQAVSLVLLGVFLIIFIIVDIALLLFLRRKNKKLVKSTDLASYDENGEDYTADKNDSMEIK